MNNNPTPPSDAAERLRRLNNGDGIRDVYQCDHYRGVASAFLKDQWEVIDARLRETDPTLITEDFAKSVAVEINQFCTCTSYQLADGCNLVLYKSTDTWEMFNHPNIDHVHVKTIGQFYTACRLFGVKAEQKKQCPNCGSTGWPLTDCGEYCLNCMSPG